MLITLSFGVGDLDRLLQGRGVDGRSPSSETLTLGIFPGQRTLGTAPLTRHQCVLGTVKMPLTQGSENSGTNESSSLAGDLAAAPTPLVDDAYEVPRCAPIVLPIRLAGPSLTRCEVAPKRRPTSPACGRCCRVPVRGEPRCRRTARRPSWFARYAGGVASDTGRRRAWCDPKALSAERTAAGPDDAANDPRAVRRRSPVAALSGCALVRAASPARPRRWLPTSVTADEESYASELS